MPSHIDRNPDHSRHAVNMLSENARATSRRVAVIGAGIVGTTIALRLVEEGHEVTLLDPDPPGQGASYGNAGSVSPGSIVPLALPGTIKSIPRWMADPLGPLSVSLLHGPRLLPWLHLFWRAGRVDRVKEIVRAMQTLQHDCVEAYDGMLHDAGVPELLVREGMLHVFRTEQAYASSAFARQLRIDRGVTVRLLSAEEIRRHSPHLADSYRFGFLLPDGAHVRNPERVVRSLSLRFEARGGQRLSARVEGFDVRKGRVRGLCTQRGVLQDTDVVLAAGIGSVALAKQLGVRVPVVAERGYHIQIEDPQIDVSRPVTDAEAKCVATPMEGGLRFAGTSEFTSERAPPNWKRAEVLERHARTMYPAVTLRGVRRWTGSRPSTPDSMPVVCEVPRHPGVFFAFGHGHWGLMSAPATARLVADLVARRAPSIDAHPFHVARF